MNFEDRIKAEIQKFAEARLGEDGSVIVSVYSVVGLLHIDVQFFNSGLGAGTVEWTGAAHEWRNVLALIPPKEE